MKKKLAIYLVASTVCSIVIGKVIKMSNQWDDLWEELWKEQHGSVPQLVEGQR